MNHEVEETRWLSGPDERFVVTDQGDTVRLPSVMSLRAFEAATRHKSFLRASEELNISPSAVSHQISTLESFLGSRLFLRLKNGVEPTPEGWRFAKDVSVALGSLNLATRRFFLEVEREPIRIAMHTLTWRHWLVPRLDSFRKCFPKLHLDAIAKENPVDLLVGGVDMAIDHTSIEAAEKGGHDILIRRYSTPICSPTWIEKVGKVSKPQDLFKIPLIENLGMHNEWEKWFESRSVARTPLAISYRFADRSMVIDAARSGLGAVLGCPNLLRHDIRSGHLVAPLGKGDETGDCYCLKTSSSLRDIGNIAKFRSWILKATNV